MNESELKQHYYQNYRDIDTFLMDLGISREHIDELKHTKIEGYNYPSIVFDFMGQTENMVIPTGKIIGSNVFGNIGYYWYDLIRYAFAKNNKGYGLNMEPSSLRNCLVYLYNDGWDKWNKSYQTGAIGNLYFCSLTMPEGEKIYMHQGGEGGGRHRFFASKIGNADYIRAEYVDEFRLNTEKLEYYRKITDKEAEIMRFIQNSTLFEKKYHKHKDEKDCCDIEIVHQDLYYTISIGELFCAESMLKSTEHFKAYLMKLQNVLTMLENIESTTLLQHQWKYRFYPEWHLKKKLSETKPDFEDVFKEMFATQNKLYTEMFAEYFKWHQRYDYKLKSKKQKA